MGGFSATHDQVLLILPEGGPIKPDGKIPVVKLVDHKPYYHVVESDVKVHDNGFSGCSFGGNFIYTSDSRFPSRFPIPIHDRRE